MDHDETKQLNKFWRKDEIEPLKLVSDESVIALYSCKTMFWQPMQSIDSFMTVCCSKIVFHLLLRMISVVICERVDSLKQYFMLRNRISICELETWLLIKTLHWISTSIIKWRRFTEKTNNIQLWKRIFIHWFLNTERFPWFELFIVHILST